MPHKYRTPLADIYAALCHPFLDNYLPVARRDAAPHLTLGLFLMALAFTAAAAASPETSEPWDAFNAEVNPFPPTPEFAALFRIERSTDPGGRPSAFLFIPETQLPDEKLPLVVWLHGLGEIELEQPLGALNWLSELVFNRGPQMSAYPFYVFAPRCANLDGWTATHPTSGIYDERVGPTALDAAQHRLHQILQEHPIDTERISVVGISAGATGAYAWACQEPRRFRIAALLAGADASAPSGKVPRGVVWQFVNRDDRDYRLEEGLRLNAELNSQGGLGCITVFPTAGHNVWNEAFLGEHQLLSRMLEQGPQRRQLLNRVLAESPYTFRIDRNTLKEFVPPADPYYVRIKRLFRSAAQTLPSLAGLILLLAASALLWRSFGAARRPASS